MYVSIHSSFEDRRCGILYRLQSPLRQICDVLGSVSYPPKALKIPCWVFLKTHRLRILYLSVKLITEAQHTGHVEFISFLMTKNCRTTLLISLFASLQSLSSLPLHGAFLCSWHITAANYQSVEKHETLSRNVYALLMYLSRETNKMGTYHQTTVSFKNYISMSINTFLKYSQVANVLAVWIMFRVL